MKKEVEKKLFERFHFYHPELPPTKNLMCFGFECSDGWFDIIWELSEKIEVIEKKYGHTFVIVQQVKEKFGGLRFYTGINENSFDSNGELYDWADEATDEIYKLIQEYEEKSYTICEVCGKKGKTTNYGWIQVLCTSCEKEYKEKNNLYMEITKF